MFSCFVGIEAQADTMIEGTPVGITVTMTTEAMATASMVVEIVTMTIDTMTRDIRIGVIVRIPKVMGAGRVMVEIGVVTMATKGGTSIDYSVNN